MDYEILKNSIFTLPITYSSGTCEDAINKRLSEYNDFLVENNIDSVFLREKVKYFKDKIHSMYEEYYMGHQNKAYELFKEAFEYETDDKLPVKSLLPKEALYRARINTGDIDYENGDMFHIKYDLRGKVKTQRFSFPGLPCLYLGASSYVCWVELNRPSFDAFQVAEIRLKDNEKKYEVIDLSIHPIAFFDELEKRKNGNKTEHNELSLSDYLKWWPIMAACSIAVKDEQDPFKPEYIFPQFVLQYFLEDKTDEIAGIKYLSIKAGKISELQYEADYRTYTNYVIPVKSSKPNAEGYCDVLSNQFEIKRNMSGKELQLISTMINDNNVKWVVIDENAESNDNNEPLDNTYLYTKNGTSLLYGRSVFRKIEKILSGDALKDISLDGTEEISSISDTDIKALFTN